MSKRRGVASALSGHPVSLAQRRPSVRFRVRGHGTVVFAAPCDGRACEPGLLTRREFDADDPIAAPYDLDVAHFRRTVVLKRKPVRQVRRLDGRDEGAPGGNIDDRAVRRRSDSARIGPNAKARRLTLAAALIVTSCHFIEVGHNKLRTSALASIVIYLPSVSKRKVKKGLMGLVNWRTRQCGGLSRPRPAPLFHLLQRRRRPGTGSRGRLGNVGAERQGKRLAVR